MHQDMRIVTKKKGNVVTDEVIIITIAAQVLVGLFTVLGLIVGYKCGRNRT